MTTTKIGFATAVAKYGDHWRRGFQRPDSEKNRTAKTLDDALGRNNLTDATSDVHDFFWMSMCERYGRLWQKGDIT